MKESIYELMITTFFLMAGANSRRCHQEETDSTSYLSAAPREDRLWTSRERPAASETGNTSRPPSTSSVATWTSIPDRSDQGYPRKTRKNLFVFSRVLHGVRNGEAPSCSSVILYCAAKIVALVAPHAICIRVNVFLSQGIQIRVGIRS